MTVEVVRARYQPTGSPTKLVPTWLTRWLELRRREMAAGSLSPNFVWELEQLAALGAHFSFFDRISIHDVPYGVLQAYSVVILLLIALWLPSRYTRAGDVYTVFGCYVGAKIAETLDAQLYALGHVVSGHTLKHLAAAAGAFVVCRMLWLRAPRSRHRPASPVGG